MKNLTTLILLVFSTLAWSVDQVALMNALQISDDRDRRIALNDLTGQRGATLTQANVDLLVTHLQTEDESIIIGNIMRDFARQNHHQAIQRVFDNNVNIRRLNRRSEAILRGISNGDENPVSRAIMEQVVNYSAQNNFPRSNERANWHALDYIVDDEENNSPEELEALLLANLSSQNTYSLSRRDALDAIIDLEDPKHNELLISQIGDRDFSHYTDDIVENLVEHGTEMQRSQVERILVSRLTTRTRSGLERRDALKALLVMDKPEHTDLLVSLLGDREYTVYVDDMIEQIGKYGNKSHLARLVDFLGDERQSNRLEALRSIQLIMDRELTDEQKALIGSCLPNVEVEPYSDDARAIGMLVDIVLTMGLTTAAMWDGREVSEPLDQETINIMKSFFESILS